MVASACLKSPQQCLAHSDKRLLLSRYPSPRVAGEMLGYGKTYIFRLLKNGELKSYRDGGARRIITQSLRDYVARRLAEDAEPARRGRPKKKKP